MPLLANAQIRETDAQKLTRSAYEIACAYKARNRSLLACQEALLELAARGQARMPSHTSSRLTPRTRSPPFPMT